jgi:hypothetical protein
MKKLWAILLLSASVTALRAQTTDVTVYGVTFTDPGIYSAVTTKKVPAPGTAAGTTNQLDNLSLVSRTETIPARIGTRFGFYYTVTGVPAGTQIQIKFATRPPSPGLKNPNTGETTYIDESTTYVTLGGSGNYHGWTFDYDYELLPGRWTFEIWYGDRKLGEQSFNVVPAQ